MAWSNKGLIKSYTGSGEIPAYSVVAASGSAGVVILGTSAAGPIIGAADELPSSEGERRDVVHSGIADLTAGAACTFGEFLTCGTQGYVIPATAGDRTIGIAMEPADAAGDRIPVCLNIVIF